MDNIQKMIDAICDFGMDPNDIEELLDKQTLEQLYHAITEYKKNKTSHIPHEVMW